MQIAHGILVAVAFSLIKLLEPECRALFYKYTIESKLLGPLAYAIAIANPRIDLRR